MLYIRLYIARACVCLCYNIIKEKQFMTCIDFSEQQVADCWEARQKRGLKRLLKDRNDYSRMLRIFKTREYVLVPTDRTEYLKKWRLNNRDKVSNWAKKYALARKVQRQETRMSANLSQATEEQLEFALSQKKSL